MNIETIRDFLGWCTLINFGVLILMTVSLVLLRPTITRLHARMFGFSETALPLEFYRFIAYYKIAVLIFNLVPYLALRVMA
jgi:hypothetical protein